MTERAVAINRALSISWTSSDRERTADITTVGRRSGKPRRIEIWFYRVDDAIYLAGRPGPRSWYANALAHPRVVLHLKHGVVADLPARAVVVREGPERERVLGAVVQGLNAGAHAGGRRLEEWLAGSPLVRLDFDDPAVGPSREGAD